MTKQTRSFRVLSVAAMLALHACASVPPREPVPPELLDEAAVPGIALARSWGDAEADNFEVRIAKLRGQLEAAEDPAVFTSPYAMLSISGGGADGAFTAGLLKGWSEAGTRPQFRVVTGVSTGALIAPLAFLGADYDAQLELLYTTLSTADVVENRNPLTALTGDSLTDTAPLRKLMKQIYDRTLIEQVAVQHQLGRRLLVGTTNLDTQRPVTWNLGEIAVHDSEESRQLFRDVMLASASIPGIFPPVRLQVSAEGRRYDELHVDGGIASQVFLYPAAVNLRELADRIGLEGALKVYVIRNGKLNANWSAVEPALPSILAASMEAITRSQGIGDLYRIYATAERDGLEYRLAVIPEDFDARPGELFDAAYMRALFDRAYSMALRGFPWRDSPPELVLP